MTRPEIGTRLKSARDATGLSQEKAAVAIGTTRATLGLWESGKRQAPGFRIRDLADLYRVSTDYLLCLVDDPVPHQARDAGATSPDAGGAAAASGVTTEGHDRGLEEAEGLKRPTRGRSKRAG